MSTKTYRRSWTTDRWSQIRDGTGHLTTDVYLPSNIVSSDSVTGGTLPGWRKRIARHTSATTSLTGTKHFALNSFGVATQVVTATQVHTVSWGALLDNGMSYNTSITSAIDAFADNTARSNLLKSVIGHQNTWRGGNFLAEIRETMHMVRHPLESLYRTSWDYVGKLGKLRKVARAAPRRHVMDLISDAWLAFAFGARPLVADIQDATKLLKERAGSVYGADVVPIKGVGRRQTVSTSPGFSVSVPNVTNTDCTQTTKFTWDVKYYGAMKAQPPGVGTLAAQAGVSPYDIIPAAWEATGFSFLVDYFVNVQENLDAMRYWSVDLAWLNRGVRNNSTVTRSNPSAHNTAGFVRSMDGSLAVRALTFVSRVGTGLPYPTWHFQMPGFTSTKWMNMAALGVQYRKAISALL